eukprot:418811_1
MASGKEKLTPSEKTAWQEGLLLNVRQHKDEFTQQIHDKRQGLVRGIEVLDEYEVFMAKGFQKLEENIRNDPLFAVVKTEHIEAEQPMFNITSSAIPTIETIRPSSTMFNITPSATASLPPNITNIPPIADGPLLDDIKDKEPVLDHVKVELENMDINTTPTVRKYPARATTQSPYASRNRSFKNVRIKPIKKIKMNTDNKLKKKTLKIHNKKIKKKPYRRLKIFQFDLDSTIKGIHDNYYIKGRKKTYKCPFYASCQFENASRWVVIEHLRGHHASRPYVCVVCGKSWKRPRVYQKHLKLHNP